MFLNVNSAVVKNEQVVQFNNAISRKLLCDILVYYKVLQKHIRLSRHLINIYNRLFDIENLHKMKL